MNGRVVNGAKPAGTAKREGNSPKFQDFYYELLGFPLRRRAGKCYLWATKATGLKTWLIGARGGSFTDQGFTDWFSEEMAKAGLPARCVPHGLRKRCLTDLAEQGKTIHEIMAVSGHLTMKEVERYTRMADRARNARAAMAGRV
jgi:integrase